MLEAIEKRAWEKFGAAFPRASRRATPRGDARAWTRTRWRARTWRYGKFKWLVLVGYYHSEVGATQELRYELVPGAWRSCLPLSEVGRASAV